MVQRWKVILNFHISACLKHLMFFLAFAVLVLVLVNDLFLASLLSGIACLHFKIVLVLEGLIENL